MEQNQVFAGLMGLMSGLTAAFAYMQVMALGKLGEPESRTVFYFAVGSAVAGAIGMAATGISPLGLAPRPVAAAGRHAGLAGPAVHDAGLQPDGATLVVASLQYFGHRVRRHLQRHRCSATAIPLSGWAGMALIVASGIAATVLRAPRIAR